MNLTFLLHFEETIKLSFFMLGFCSQYMFWYRNNTDDKVVNNLVDVTLFWEVWRFQIWEDFHSRVSRVAQGMIYMFHY